MTKARMHPLAELDQRFVWHPFTQMKEWLGKEPIVIVSGQGAILYDAHGREYLDANSSIWTNLHGHRNRALDGALRKQLRKVAHTSALGLANEPASVLAAELVRIANPPRLRSLAQPELVRVFFSDDGSTALEVALKMCWEFARRIKGSSAPRYLSIEGAYHGDTIGAVSLGHIARFHGAYRGLLFPTDAVMAPYCYRCPFNRAKPARADARQYRECGWECVGKVEQAFTTARQRQEPYAAMVVEPGIQGAAGMIPQPETWLSRVAQIARSNEALLIADEVMTGFGRTGIGSPDAPVLFASHHEDVQPDFLNAAKGLTGGYLPLAATLTTQAVFDAFLGDYNEYKTFFHGHSYTANQLGSAVASANLEILNSANSIHQRTQLQAEMSRSLEQLWSLPSVGDIRQVGLIAGIELVKDWQTRLPFDPQERVGTRICEAMAGRGVLTRPVGDVIVVMPPYCTTERQLRQMIAALAESIEETLGPGRIPISAAGPRARA